MPSLSASLKRKAARIVGSDEFLLRYYHFSVVVHAERRMPIVTAVNIDGPTWKKINRETRAVTDPFESTETWYSDSRIEATSQSQQSDYNAISRLFDRGHMVRREDPQWGNDEQALEAMDDTFHFTNCCPQNWLFNERPAFWQGIENYVLDGMRSAPERVSVFTGPLFARDDPSYGNLRVPWSFWKILARLARGELRATGFIASQRTVISDPRERLGTGDWPIGDDEPVGNYQATVAEIERRAGLTFVAKLQNADTFRLGFERVGDTDLPMRRLEDPAQANW